MQNEVTVQSLDGNKFLFTHFGEGSSTNYSVYLRSTDGSPAIRLGDGRALALSPDGKFAIAKLNVPEQLNLLPTKAGEVRQLPRGNIEHYDRASWFPDNQHILFTGNESGRGKRSYIQNISSGEIKPVTPEGIAGTLLSPDGKMFVASTADGQKIFYSTDTGENYPIEGLEKDDEGIGWSEDGKSLFVFQRLNLPIKIYEMNIVSDRKKLIKEIIPSDPAGVFGPLYVFLTPDTKSYVYGLRKYFFDLYSVEGLDMR